MAEQMTIKPEALEPLFAAWEEPEKHRVKKSDGEGAEVRQGRRPSSICHRAKPPGSGKGMARQFLFWFQRHDTVFAESLVWTGA